MYLHVAGDPVNYIDSVGMTGRNDALLNERNQGRTMGEHVHHDMKTEWDLDTIHGQTSIDWSVHMY